MIVIERAEKYRACNCCHSIKNVSELTFRYEGTNSGMGIALCSRCLEELKEKTQQVETPDKRTETHPCDCDRKETHGDVISREDAIGEYIEQIRWERDVAISQLKELGYGLGEKIRKLPSAQPEIVRCKDCKWKQGSECVRFAEVRPFPDDFCSRAERRTDE